jgi:hypothetical protein
MIGAPYRKRDALVALAVGAIIAFALNIWFNAVAKPETIDSYLWLARLQEPGAQVGERLIHPLYRAVGYPWNVRIAVLFGYGTLVVLWTALVLSVMGFGRLTISVLKRRSGSYPGGRSA